MALIQGDDLILEPQGRLLVHVDGAEVTYTEDDGVTPLAIYADEAGTIPVTQPLTTRYGRVEPQDGGDWWHEPQIRIRHATHPDGRELAPLQQEAYSAVDSTRLTSVEHRVAFLSVTEAPYNATGDGTTNDTTAITNADAAALLLGKTLLFPAGTYRVSQVLPTTSWRGEGAILKATAGSTSVLLKVADTVSGITVDAFKIDGSAASGASTAAMVELGGADNTLKGLRVVSAPYDGVLVRTNATGFEIASVRVTTTGRYGITLTGTLANPAREGSVHDCRVEGSADGGFGIIGVARDVGFKDNIAVRTGGDGLAAYNADNERIAVDSFISVDAANNGIHLGGTGNSITNCEIYSSVFKGIYAQSDLSATEAHEIIAGNLVRDAGDEAYLIVNYTGLSVGPNYGYNPGTHGLSLIDCEDFSITGGVYKGAVAGSGVRLAGCQDGTIVGVTSKGNFDKGITFVIGVESSADCLDIGVSGCTVKGNATGIHSTTNASGLTIGPNTVKGNTTNFSITAKTTNRVGPQNTDTSESVASASSLTLPLGIRHFIMTGATTVTTIAAGNWKDQTVTLRCTGAITIQDVDTVRINGDFPGGSNATLTLISDGSRWWEVARSLNA